MVIWGRDHLVKSLPQILLVDDNPADIVLMREALAESARQIQVSDVQDGEEALAFLRCLSHYQEACRPDLVILDINLPKKDGRAVLAEVKADRKLRSIPVIVFSTSCAKSEIARTYDLGANCYVSKPGNLKDYFSVVKSMEAFWFGSATLPREEK
jgi:chemotaxis family two-component system response regulator Rcp1